MPRTSRFSEDEIAEMSRRYTDGETSTAGGWDGADVRGRCLGIARGAGRVCGTLAGVDETHGHRATRCRKAQPACPGASSGPFHADRRRV